MQTASPSHLGALPCECVRSKRGGLPMRLRCCTKLARMAAIQPSTTCPIGGKPCPRPTVTGWSRGSACGHRGTATLLRTTIKTHTYLAVMHGLAFVWTLGEHRHVQSYQRGTFNMSARWKLPATCTCRTVHVRRGWWADRTVFVYKNSRPSVTHTWHKIVDTSLILPVLQHP